VRDGDGSTARIVGDVTAGRDGKFQVELRRGSYCFVREEKGVWVPHQASAAVDGSCRAKAIMACDGQVTVGDGPVDGVEVRIVRTCGDPCVRGDAKLPPRARGVGRAAAEGAVRHLVGTVKTTASWWSGVPPPPDHYARQRNPPPTPGEMVSMRPGTTNHGQAPIAQVVTDSEGRFDVAVPAGALCVQSGFREQYFVIPPRSRRSPALDYGCMEKERAKCDAVIPAGTKDVGGIDIRVHRPSPPDAPCRRGPYIGPYPPSAR
jgi:hypothetical protein